MLPAVEIGKHQHVGAARDSARPFYFFGGNGLRQGRVALQLPIDRQIRVPCLDRSQRGAHLVDARRGRAAMGRERQQRHARFLTEQASGACRGGDGDVGELVCVGVGIDRAVGKHIGARRLPGTIIRKKLDGVAMPGARPMVICAASITRRVGLATPATRAAASPAATMAAPKYRGLRSRRSAMLALVSRADANCAA